MGRNIKQILRRDNQNFKKNPLGFLIIEPEHLKFRHEKRETLSPKVTKTKKREKTYCRRQRRKNQKLKWQHGSFLNQYDFAYAGRDFFLFSAIKQIKNVLIY